MYHSRNIPPHAIETVRNFSRYVLENRDAISNKTFAKHLCQLGSSYRKNQLTEDIFSREADMLADELFELNKFDFVSIIMSKLCKINRYRIDALEFFAKKGLSIAEIQGDYVHMVARLNDLRNIYFNNPAYKNEYIHVLRKEENYLKIITQSYDDAKKSFGTCGHKMAPLETYELMLAQIQADLAKYIKNCNPQEAKKKLTSALRLFNKHGVKKPVKYIAHIYVEILRKNKYPETRHNL